jgi:2-methylcitrate dehydratase PrpD
MTGPTTLLAAHAVRMRHEPMAPDVREKAVLCLLDAVALAFAARAHETVEAAVSIATELTASQPGATVWPTGTRTTVADAALVNGIAAHAHFQDDTDMDAWAHPGSLIVPAALAAAEQSNHSLDTAVRAIVAGYTALNWLGAEGEVGHALVERGFRASPTLGSIAAAVCAATALGLDEQAAANAVGLATDVTGGLLEPVRTGAQDWRWQNGTAAWRGTMAALLASRGVRGPAEPLAGPQGFLAAFCAGDVPEGWTRPPHPDAIRKVWFKRYPILGDNMAPAVAAADLHGEVGNVAAIADIEVHINEHFAAYPGTSFLGPFETVEQAVASTAFAVAALLAHGDIAYADYPTLLADRTVGDLVGKVRVVPESGYGFLDSMVTGRLTRRTVDCPREVFFRDRATARQEFARVTSRAGDLPSGLPDVVFDWLDGGPEPPVAEMLTLENR